MNPDDIKVGVTYVNEYEWERTVIEIRPGIPKNKQHIMFVRYISDDNENINLTRLKEFAKWAKGPKVTMPIHRCAEKKEHAQGTCSIKFNVHDKEWIISIHGSKAKVIFCPYCGVNLDQKMEEKEMSGNGDSDL